MNANPLIGILTIYSNWYNKLNLKQRRLLIIFALGAFFYLYFNSFLRPALKDIARLKKEQLENKARTQLSISQFPDLDKVKFELENIRQNAQRMRAETAGVESKLISLTQIPQLLTKLMKCAGGLPVDFASVKQKIETGKDGFSRLYIDLKFDSTYEDAVNYIKRAEEASSFVKVETIDLVQSKSDPRNLVSTNLRLSALLASLENTQGQLIFSSTAADTGLKLSVARSPLMPKFNIGQAKRKELRLTGITYREGGRESTAIVNDNVVKIGDEIDGRKLERILPDSVIVNDGIESQTLRIER